MKRADLRAFPRPVQDILLEADGLEGVEVKLLDGSHARLLNGDRAVRPIKVSGSRSAEDTIRRLVPWLERNVPAWAQREESKMASTIAEMVPEVVDDLQRVVSPGRKEFRCAYGCDLEFDSAREMNDHYDERHRDDSGHSDTPTPSRWRPYVSSSGRGFGFETDGQTFRCTSCTYTQETRNGLHLHEAKHTGKAAEYAAAGGRGGRGSSKSRAKPKTVAGLEGASEEATTSYVEALQVLASGLGMEVVPKGAKSYAEVVRERDEAVARLDLMREALGA